ncbi:Cna B-type domain-containing protein [Salisediminibacterium halotolerans]|uniref:Uncharacterized surface anchored protein n=1 Tax=Salisediminibacterium halotolerans TaxID=517425 RepID=A0A1H9WA05_9BACI|nr:Cna B-type domain-containing protein [Salisediminibacterium haloalkalitolerans]SES30675.1 Uncharacterized surface anchored protein [Salisediminibacterium haloalkalitolerans]
MIKKTVYIFLIVALVFQTMSNSLLMLPGVSAEDNTSEPSVFKDLRFIDEEKNEVGLDDTGDREVVNVQVTWSDEDLNIEEGYTESMELPEALQIKEETSGPISADQESDTAENENVGDYQVTGDGLLTVDFNEFIEQYDEPKGEISFGAEIEGNTSDSESDNHEAEESEESIQSSNNELNEESAASNENESEENGENEPETEENNNIDENKEDEANSEGNESAGNNENVDTNEQEENASEKNATNDEQANESKEDEENNTEETIEGEDGANNESSEENISVESNTFTAKSKEITENIITDVKLTKDGVDLGAGEEIEVESPYDQFEFKLDYQFALPEGHEYGNGSTFTINVPEMFNIPNVPESEQESLIRADGTEFGTYYTKGNEIKITFNENIEQESNISGDINLSSSLDDDYDGPATGDVIEFPIAGEESLEFPIRFLPDEKAIEKQGVGNRGYNTETVEWTVDLNKDLQMIENAKLDDELIEGDHSYVEDSLKIYELAMNANGEVNDKKELTGHDFGSEFPLEFGTIDSAYRVIYETEINDMTGETYKNDVTLTGDDYDPINETASVAVTRGEPLEKEAAAYDDVTQTITWEVRYNYDEKLILQEDAKLADTFADNQELVDNSLSVSVVEIDEDTGEESGTKAVDTDDYTLTETDDGFELQFAEDIDGAYKLTYETTAIDRIEKDLAVNNTISDEFTNTSEGSGEVSQGIFIKAHGSTDYEAKKTDWSVVINRDEQVMENVVFTDTLPEGFAPEEFEVVYDGNPMSETNDYEYSYDASTREIEVEFKQSLEKRVDIAYTTSIDFDEAGRKEEGYRNSARLEWAPEGESESVSRDEEAVFDPDEYTENNGFKRGNYDLENKEITWTIGVNYNNETLEDVFVEDYILGGQNFDIEDVDVFEMDLTGEANGYEIGEEVTGTEIEPVESAEGDSGFRVGFGDITSAYVIQYTTNLDNQIVKSEYSNNALAESSNKDDIELTATVNPNYGGEFSNKAGQQNADNGRVVNWDIAVNYSQSTVADFEITDTLSENQTILQETLTVYETIYSGGDISKAPQDELEKGADYTVDFFENDDGQESFTLQFTDEIDQAYVVEYDSYILYEGDGEFSNSVSYEGVGQEDISGSDETSDAISFNNISGSIRGEVGALEIAKVDAEDNETLLEGAEFHLYDESGDVLIQTGETDENGELTFANLLYGEYQLVEVNAPEGYAVDRKVGSTRTPEVNEDVTEITVENYEIKRDVQLTKEDGTTGETLEGVEFQLFDAEDQKIDSYTTSNDGEIYVEDLDPGDYYFEESAPAEHYQENSEEYPFTIIDEHTILDIEEDALTVENELEPGSAYMDKIDADKIDTDNNGLEGATFHITNTDEDSEINFERTVTSDENGRVETGDLRPGTYTIEEDSPPDGFELSDDNEPVEFNIELSQEEPIEISSQPFENNVKTTSLEVTKTDSINEQLLADAEFELTYANGDYDVDPSPRTARTNEKGIAAFDELKPGTYEIEETDSPEGYIAADDAVEVTVTLGDVHTEQTVGVNVENDPLANINLTKVDAETDVSLAGAVFTLEDTNGDEIDEYEELTTDSNGDIRITGLPAGEYILKETEAPEGYTIQEDGFEHEFEVDGSVNETENIEIGDVDNEINKGSVRLIKDDGESNERLENVEFTLNAVDLVNDGTYSETTYTTDSNGEIIVEELRPGNYVFEEVAPLAGYQPHWGDIEFELNFPHEEEQIDIDVANYQLVSVDVEKQWNDDENLSDRPDEVEVNLLQNGSNIGERVELSEENDWSATFEELDAVDSKGEFYNYTVEEVIPGDGYQLQEDIEGSQETGFTITNVETRTVEVEKIWLDDTNRLDDRPDEVEFQLQRDGEPLRDPVNVTGPDWEHAFTDLPVYDPEGNQYDYTVKETSLDDNYELVDVNGDQDSGYEIVNRLTGNVDIPVTKEWNDTADSADRPENITVEVYQNLYDEADYPEEAYDTQVISSDNDGNWESEFTQLPEFDDQGRALNYDVVEVPVEGYDAAVTSEEEEVTITNTRSGEVAVEGEKSWEDDDENDRPDSVTVNLLQNQAVIDSAEISEDDDWAYSFSELPEFDDNGEAYDYEITEQDVPGYAVDIDGYDITNTRSEQRDIEVTKGWLDDGNPDRPEEITVTLLADEEPFETVNITEDGDWVHVFEDLEAYDEQGRAISYSVEEEALEGYETEIDGFNIKNIRSEKTSLGVDKNWLDDEDATNDRPDNIVVDLFRSDDPDAPIDTKVIRSSDEWTHTFTDLEKFDDEGAEYSYDITEHPVTDYEVTQSQTDAGFELTNLREGTINLDVTKEWNDGAELDERPEDITVHLYRSDDTETPYDSAVIEEDNEGWNYTFEDLDQFDDQGIEYHYTVEEEPVENYNSEPVTGNMTDGYELMNTLQTDVPVEKIWLDTEDNEDRLDTVTVDLLRNGENYDEVALDSDMNWQAVFENLSKYDSEGQDYEYTVEERDLLESYVLNSITGNAAEGYTITNLRTGEVTVEGEKSWEDDDENDRPDSVTVNLLQNQAVIDSAEISEDDDWAYSFSELPEFDDNGEAYDYEVTEQDVPGYAVDIDGYDITNTRSEQRDIEVTKSWLDDGNPDRPEEITVTLLADEEPIETVNITEDGDWVHVFEDLEAYDEQGEAIAYTVKEDTADGYESSIDGFNITNLRTGETEVRGKKTWLDEDESNRPEEIEVNLEQNGEVIDKQEVTAEDSWTYVFNELAKYDDEGEAYSYSVSEEVVEGYETDVDGYDITNVRTGTVDVDVTKTWQDDEESDRPEAITVNLKQNGEVIETEEITADDGWAHSFTDLDEFNSVGEVYDYTIGERGVPGYTLETDGYELINTRTEETAITVTKTWLDEDDEERPDAITVELLRNGESEDEAEVNAEDGWTYEFEDLDAYDENGQAIVYTVEEHTVEGYETDVDGYDITNVRTGTVDVDITKTWQDDEESDRPEAITVNLKQNGEVIETEEITADDGWAYKFKNLPEFNEKGVKYHYTIHELETYGYSSEVDGFKITNTLVPDKSEEKDSKEDDDADSEKDESADIKGKPEDAEAEKHREDREDREDKDDKDDKDGGTLPETATSMFSLLLFGTIFIFLGFAVLIFDRIKKRKV